MGVAGSLLLEHLRVFAKGLGPPRQRLVDSRLAAHAVRCGMAYRRRGTSTPPGESLTAAAESLASRLALSTGTRVGEEWQKIAWDFYDRVPELRAAARITGQTCSQVRLNISRISSNGEPIPVTEETDPGHPALKLLAGFAGGQGGQSALLDSLGVQMTVPGETILVGSLDPSDQYIDDFARVQAYSPEQVIVQNRKITVKLDDSSMKGQRTVDEEDPDMPMRAIRIWRPHPAKSYLADSATRAAMQALQEIVLYDQHIEASAISRLISAGFLLVPEGMTLPGLADDDGSLPDSDPFMRFLIKVMSTSIGDRTSAAARVPIALRGEKEDLAAMRHLTLSTPFDEQILALRAAALGRLATAVDMPGELLSGYGALQHWTGALVTQDWVNNYLPGIMTFVCNGLTTGWLYPAMANIDPDLPADVIMWYDTSGIRVRENVGPEAFQAYDRNEINGDSLRRALGYDDGDAPDADQLKKQLLIEMAKKQPLIAPLALVALGYTFSDAEIQSAAAIAQALGKPATDTIAPPAGTVDNAPDVGTEPATGNGAPAGLRAL